MWDLWKFIEAHHVQKDASLRLEARMHLFSHRKGPDETHVDYFRRGDSIGGRIEHVTPTNLFGLQLISELLRFTQISGLPSDDPLRRQLISQRNITYDDVYATFLHTDTDAKTATEAESVNAAFIVRCYRCLQVGHIKKGCPHSGAIDRVISQHVRPITSTMVTRASVNSSPVSRKAAPLAMQVRIGHLLWHRSRSVHLQS